MTMRLAGAILMGLIAASSAQAQWRGYSPQRPSGGSSFYSGPDGLTTVTRIGSTDFIYSPNGQATTVQRVGSHTFVNGPGGPTTINHVGRTDFYNGPGGLSGSSHQFGNQRLYQFSNGTSGSVRDWGGFQTYDVQRPGRQSSFGTIVPLGGASQNSYTQWPR